ADLEVSRPVLEELRVLETAEAVGCSRDLAEAGIELGPDALRQQIVDPLPDIRVVREYERRLPPGSVVEDAAVRRKPEVQIREREEDGLQLGAPPLQLLLGALANRDFLFERAIRLGQLRRPFGDDCLKILLRFLQNRFGLA